MAEKNAQEDPLRAHDAELLSKESHALETLELVTTQMAAGVTRCSRDFRYLWANQAYADWLQRPLNEVVGHAILDVLGKDAFEALLPQFMRVLTGEKAHYEQETNFQGIGRRWTSATYTPTHDASGATDGWVAVVLDITERKQAEERLRVSEERFRLAVLAGRMFAYEWKAAGDVMVRSEESKQILGADAATRTTGQQVFANVHPDDREKVAAAAAKLSPQSPFLQVSYRAVQPNGTMNWVEANGRAHFDERGQLERVIGIAADVTERKRIEEALRESEERLHLAVQAGRMYAFDWDAETDEILRSGECAAILHWIENPTRVTSRAFTACIHPDDREAYFAPQTMVTPENPTFQNSYRVLNPNGSEVWLEARGLGIFNDKGKMIRMIGMVADVTERQRAERDLSELSGRLIHAQEEERTRIARELHDDFSQQMALLQIGLEQVMLQDQISSATRKQLQSLKRTCEEVSSDLRDLSYQLHPSKLDLLGLVGALRSLCNEFSLHHNLQVQFIHHDVPKQIPKEITLCLFRITQEALRNVVKHSRAAEALVELTHHGGQIELCISDSGVGFRFEKVTAETGLGLISMRERLRLVKGQVFVESEPSHGTRIRVCVPLGISR